MRLSIPTHAWIAVAALAAACAGARAKEPERQRIPEQATKAFISCGETKELRAIVDSMMRSGRVSARHDSHFELDVQGRVLGLPFKGMWAGVCDRSGERACGWASMTAFVVDMPFDEAKASLKARYGLDFTAEKRDAETRVTQRPVLTRVKGSKSTVLYCDPGIL